MLFTGRIFQSLLSIILEAIFPLSPAERELFSYSPEDALRRLPPSLPYAGLTVPLPETKSILAYRDDRVSKLIWNIKYKKSKQAVQIGGYLLYTNLLGANFEQESSLTIVPMPISRERRRERGYNQCELLTDEIQRLATINQPSQNSTLIIINDLLQRAKHLDRQTTKNRADRLDLAKGIFSLNPKRLTSLLCNPEMVIVVIDDVITTGSTMRSALDTLKFAGFKNVYGLSLAH